MNDPKIPILFDENVYLLQIDDGEEWSAVSAAFHRHYPDRSTVPFDPANYTQQEIDAVMVEFEPTKRRDKVGGAPAPTDQFPGDKSRKA